MGYEIELKAHVQDYNQVKALLDENGTYEGKFHKCDTYYHFKDAKNSEKYISARIRKESFTKDGRTQEFNYFTYKRKEKIEGKDGKSVEVNDENEFTFTDAAPLEIFFTDLKAEISLKKEKIGEGWFVKMEDEVFHAELCTVPPIGTFLEIEIVKETNDDRTVSKMKACEEKILQLCKIDLSQIENRYYSDLLKNPL